MAEKKEISVSYDFIDNDKDELMLVMEKPDNDAADDENAKFIYDGITKAKLVRNENLIINIPVISEPVREMLKRIDSILVTEMDGEDIDDVYEAKIELSGGSPSFEW